jgi:replicative DNA helicase
VTAAQSAPEWADTAAPQEDLIPAEAIVVGSAIMSRRAAEAAAEIVRPEWFYRPAHGLILAAALRLAEDGREVDPVAVLGELTRAGDAGRTGGAPRLHDLMAQARPGWEYHARRVARDWRRRNLAAAAMSILQETQEPGFEEASFDRARKLIDDATAPPDAGDLRSMRQLVTDVIADLENEKVRGLPVPWLDLSEALTGLAPGQLIFVAGRPGIGKSVVGAQIAAHAGMTLGVPTLLVSMEMSAGEIALRLLSAESRVPLTSLLNRSVSDPDWDRLAPAARRVSDSELIIDDSAKASLAHIRSRLRGMARTRRAGLLVVDYLGLMEEPAAENRQNAVAALSRGLKLIAREFAIPVVVLAQLNRGSEHRPDKRPVASDLRDSGAQEQDADVILLLHREDAYERESPRAGEMDVIVAKNRQGPQCTVTVAFQGHYGRVMDMARQYPSQPHEAPWSGT